MASSRGPVPKRSDQRRRRNKTEVIDTGFARGGPAPSLRDGLHPLAVAWYNSLKHSGQSAFYEQSDWMTAQIITEAIDDYARKPRVALLAAILSGSSSLLATEGDRRRLRLELSRVDVDALDEDVRAEATISDIRSRLTGA